jgi:carbamoylphosphate synthase large subunit
MKMLLKKKSLKKYTMFRPRIKSRHPSHRILRGTLSLSPFRSVVRLGSTTDMADTVTNGGNRIECNTIQAIKNSSSKLLMKRCFTHGYVKTAEWFTYSDGIFHHQDDISEAQNKQIDQLSYPIVAKYIYGSRGTGNHLFKTQEELESWMKNKDLTKYIFEKFYNYNREYRLHVTEEGCFYTCRKVLKQDTPDDKRWFRNDSNSNWLIESNESFDKPINWDAIIAECVKALKAVGLDIGGFDVRVQSKLDKDGNIRLNPEFIILESNSACSFGDLTADKYKVAIMQVLNRKYKKLNGIN